MTAAFILTLTAEAEVTRAQATEDVDTTEED